MEKPVVFFSHSSHDEESLTRLKSALSRKLSGTIDIFLSSDGQSIPFGKNWVYKIEEALNNSKLMFVFISPNSLQSNWVHFEAGYSYSKEIRVIPVGILGADLNKIGPPLSLLQGFNVNSGESLNNFISTINSTFSFSYDLSFTDEDYNRVFLPYEIEDNSIFKELSPYVEGVKFELPNSYDNPRNYICEFLDRKNIKYREGAIYVYTFGIAFENLYNAHFRKTTQEEEQKLEFKVDPALSRITFPILNDLIKSLSAESFECFSFDLIFVRSVNYVKEEYLFMSRIYDTDIKVFDREHYEFGNIKFTISRPHVLYSSTELPVHLSIKYDGDDLTKIPIYELLKLLFGLKLLY